MYPDYEKPFTLHVDASRKGLGAVLHQEQDGTLHVIAYASRSLAGSEKNYTVHKLEFLALKWAITSKFHQYLYGKKFTVFTDHNPLVYVTSAARLDANGHRWLEALAGYDFTICYKPGKTHSDADGLSRLPQPETAEKLSSKVISPEVFKEICDLISGDQEFADVAESLGILSGVVYNSTHVSHPVFVDWSTEQDRDPDIARVKHLVTQGIRPSNRQRKAESPIALRLLSHWDSLFVKNGVLIRSGKIGDEKVQRVLIPAHKQQECLCLIHDDMGHLGRDKILSVAQDGFFWIGLTGDVDNKVRTCKRCICAKAPNLPEKAPLVSITTSRPMELVCMNFMSLETALGGYHSILVLTDHFTRYACAFPIRNQEARTVTKILVDEFFVHYGIPERLHSDQGANFQSKIVAHLCKMLDIKKSRTTPYHPQGDGMIERFNKTLISMLKTLDPIQKSRWKEHVIALVHAYNCTKHESTQYSPFYLMFGWQPRLPIDVFLGLDPDYTSSVESVKKRLEAAYKAASEAANKAAKRQACNYDRKARGPSIQPGDMVLLKNVGLKGKHKIADKWQQEPFTVLERPNPDIPVYRIKRGAEVKVVHRNLLLPVTLPFDFQLVESSSLRPPVVFHDDSMHDRFKLDPELDDDDDPQLSVVTHELPAPAEIDLREEVYEVQQGPDSPMHDAVEPVVPGYEAPEVLLPVGGEVVEDPILSPLGDDLFLLSSPVDEDSPSSPVFGNPLLAPTVVEDPPPPSDEGLGLRRSQRERRPPNRYGTVANQQVVVQSDWRDQISILLSLLNVFPGQQAEIFSAMMHVMKG